MKMKEKVIEALIDSIIDIELPNFNIIKASISSPYTINENEGTCEVDIKIILKEQKKKSKPKEEAKRASEDMFDESEYDRVQIGGEREK